jgi:hypothetical protein
MKRITCALVALMMLTVGCDGFRIPLVVEAVLLEAKAQGLKLGTDAARAKCLEKTETATWKRDACLLGVKLAECPERVCPAVVACPEVAVAPVVPVPKVEEKVVAEPDPRPNPTK